MAAKEEPAPNTDRSLLAKAILFLSTMATVVCGLVAGVWLGLIGQWPLLFVGFLAFASSVSIPCVWEFAKMLVTAPLGVVLLKHTSFNRLVGAVWTFFSVLTEGVLVACWTAIVFWYFFGNPENSEFAAVVLWAYSIIMSPLTFRAFRYPGLAFGGIWSLALATAAYVLLVVLDPGVGETGGAVIWLGTIVLLWSLLVSAYLTITFIHHTAAEAPISVVTIDRHPSSS